MPFSSEARVLAAEGAGGSARSARVVRGRVAVDRLGCAASRAAARKRVGFMTTRRRGRARWYAEIVSRILRRSTEHLAR
jgi:hypothetical protein